MELFKQTTIIYVVPYNNEEILKKWFLKSPTTGHEVITISVPKDGSIPKELNKILDNLPEDKWFVFCEQGIRLLKDIVPFLENRRKDTVYGITGAVIKKPEDELEIIDGRSGYSMIDNKNLDSIGQGCMIIHSFALKNFNCRFDERFTDLYLIDFSLQCKNNGMKIAALSLQSAFRERLINVQNLERYKRILRQKYSHMLPLGLWSGILSSNELEDLKSYVSLRDDWIRTLIKEKAHLRARLQQHEKILQSVYSTKSFTGLVDNSNSSESKILQEYYDELEKKLVWIFGTPRSGSTWLASEILRGEGIRLLDEPAIGIHLGAFFDNPQIHWNLFNGNYNANFTRIIDRDRDSLFFSSKYGHIWKDSLRFLILNRVEAQFGFTGYDHIIIKAPNESHAADIIMNCLPKSRLIFLVRDGRDVIDSRQGRFHNPRPGAKVPETPEERKFRISHFALMWNYHTSITNNAFNSHNPDLRFFVRYEDLRLDPLNEIKRIYRFLGINVSESYIKKIADETDFEHVPHDQKGEDKNKRKARPGGYKEYFTEEELKILNKIMKENLVKFGYKLDQFPSE